MKLGPHHLAYCTNIHPAETWAETDAALRSHVLKVRDRLREQELLDNDAPFAIGLRLSAIAAAELVEGDRLSRFKDWLAETNTYVFTINGFPYGNFHGTRVKERVFLPDWTSPARVEYTKNLFRILSIIADSAHAASVSTLPGSHKSFAADEAVMVRNLSDFGSWLDDFAHTSGHDFHLGMEPEPLGHFENTPETLAFFERLQAASRNPEAIRRRIGVNYDACHFALQFEDAAASLDALCQAGLRLSKVHLSSALAFSPDDSAALTAIRAFDEPVYFHQVLVKDTAGLVHRFRDLPDFLDSGAAFPDAEARVHFHIPLDREPEPPLRSTLRHAQETLAWCGAHRDSCGHFEIETYTWAVLPDGLRRPVDEQIAAEYRWVLDQCVTS